VEAEAVDFSRFCFHTKRTASASTSLILNQTLDILYFRSLGSFLNLFLLQFFSNVVGLSWCSCLFMEGLSSNVVSSSVVFDDDCGISNTGLSGPTQKTSKTCDVC